MINITKRNKCTGIIIIIIIIIIFKTSLLKYNCFTMGCQFLLYNKVNQLYVYIYSHISSLLHLPPTLPIPPLQVALFIFFILSCMNCLYILALNPLSVASFANIFSHSEGCLFVLFMVSFAAQKLLSFIRSHLFFLFFFILASLLMGGVVFLSCQLFGMGHPALELPGCWMQLGLSFQMEISGRALAD